MDSWKKALWIASATLLLPLAVLSQYTEITYSPGRCDGQITMEAGAQAHVVPVDPPGPQVFTLWLYVAGGEGNTIISDGTSNATDGFYFHTGDLILLETEPPFDVFFQGGTITLAYGGVVFGAPQSTICATGASGPVVLKVDTRYDARLETSTANVSVKAGSYASVGGRISGTLNYLFASGFTLQGTFAVPTCAACCDPQTTVFPVSKAGTAAYTLYSLTSAPAADFDYALAAPVALSATADGTPVQGKAPLPVAFTGSAAGGIPPYTWNWDFGDGSPHKTVQNPSHTYSSAGTYNAILNLKDSNGNSATDSHLTITVKPAFTATASADGTQGQIPLTVTFAGTTSGGTAPFTYSWDFGDGSAISSDQNPSHTYAAVGSFTVALTAKDSAGLADTDNHLVIKTVAPGVLAASAQANPTLGIVPLGVQFTGIVTGGVAPFTYSWDFGDGTAASTALNPQHTYSSAGAYIVAFTVQDGAGGSATDDHLRINASSSFVTTASAIPTAGPVPLAVQFSGAAAGGTAPYAYAWDFGDGGSSTAASPAHTYAAVGTYSVLLTVTDSTGQSALDGHLTVTAGGASGSVVTGVSKLTDPFRLKIKGSGFQAACVAFINGTPVNSTAYKSSDQVIAKGGDALKSMVPKGVPVCVQVHNPDGTLSACYTYTR